MAPFNIKTASDDEIVDLCHQIHKKDGGIEDNPWGNLVVKLSDKIAVKIGLLQASEAAMQKLANETLHPGIVRIPKVYRFIQSARSGSSFGYIVMQYMPGRRLTDADLDPDSGKDIVLRLATIVACLGQIRGSIPGPVDGGIPRDYVFGDEGAQSPFTSSEEMNAYMNKRLAYVNEYLHEQTRGVQECVNSQ
ncbi:hypothetical protein BJX99DRAFT_253909 [Aspergillus californicus]